MTDAERIPAPAEHAPAKYAYPLSATATQPARLLVAEHADIDDATASGAWVSCAASDTVEVRR